MLITFAAAQQFGAKQKKRKPLRVSVKVDWHRPAGLPEEIQMTRKDVARVRRVVWDWIRKHPSENLKALMDLIRLNILIVPGMPHTKGREYGDYSPRRNTVTVSPVILSERTGRPIRQTKKSIETALSHEIEGHMLDYSLPLYFRRIKRLPKIRLDRFLEKHPKLKDLFATVYEPLAVHDDCFTYEPKLLETYKKEKKKIKPAFKRLFPGDWCYLSDIEELGAFFAQFRALSRTARRTRKPKLVEVNHQWNFLTPTPLDEDALVVVTSFPKTIKLIKRFQDAILDI